jgi:hypothetical protein
MDNSLLCRQFVNTGSCPRRNKCRFHHPQLITETIKKRAIREPGRCYCGAKQKTLVNNRKSRNTDDLTFFVVCSRTMKSMKKCI